MEAWGDSPLQSLARRNEFVTFELNVAPGGRTAAPAKIIISRVSVEKKTSWRDYGQGGGLRAEIPDKRFEDIVGLESAKLALEEMSLTLKNRGALTKAGVPAPRGALLWGAPGTAKTTLAKAMANQAGLPFIAATGPDLLQAGFISRVFSVARKYQPSIVFIDEIDALGRRGQGGNDLAINLLLSEIDGINVGAESSVFVLAATNFPSKVDEALLRSGRIECHIEIPTLDKPARLAYFQRFTPWAEISDSERDQLAELATGLSGADLERCLRQVILLREKSGVPLLKAEDVKDVVRDVSFGPLLTRSDPPSEKYLSLVACHEAGHVIVSQALTPSRRLVEVSIEPRKTAGRCTFAGDSVMQDLATVRSELASLLAGRVAETICFGEAGMGSGARQDFESATALARRAIMEWGLDAEIGVVHLASLCSSSPLSETLRMQIEKRVVYWLDEAQTHATQALTLHADQHLTLSNALLERKRLSGLEVSVLLEPRLDLVELSQKQPERQLSLVAVSGADEQSARDFEVNVARMAA
jgi:ATP-dependent Zn protease